MTRYQAWRIRRLAFWMTEKKLFALRLYVIALRLYVKNGLCFDSEWPGGLLLLTLLPMSAWNWRWKQSQGPNRERAFTTPTFQLTIYLRRWKERSK